MRPPMLLVALCVAAVATAACDPKSAGPEAPAAPSTPGGLAGGRAPIGEAPFAPESPDGAAEVAQAYAAHLGQKDYAAAYALLRDPAVSLVQFAQGFDKYQRYEMQVGAPGVAAGAAGASLIEAPVLVHGRLKTGETVSELGWATLQRLDEGEGSTPGRRLWRIVKIETRPTAANGVVTG